MLLPVCSFAQERMLEEVIVTAQKRSESVQDVPLAVSAIGAATIEEAGIISTTDLTRLVPSLTATEGQNKQNASFNIRGVGTNVFSIGVETSVAVVIDDVSTVQAGQALTNLVDIERIEVLRGPQSTLFGKSASAGLINVATKAPAEELEGFVQAAATDDDEQRVSGSISGPITDTTGYRLTGYWSDLDGYLDNLTYGDELNRTKSWGTRGKFRWDISELVHMEAIAYYGKDDSDCCGGTWVELDPEARLFNVVQEPPAPDITPGDENRKIRTDDRPDSKNRKCRW